MGSFKYKGRDTNGEAIDGLMDAENEGELATKLAEMNIVLVEAKTAKTSQESSTFYLGKVKRKEIILFTNHLAMSVEAGVSVIQAISDYAREVTNERVKKIIQDVERQVLSGTTLSAAMSQHPEAFSELYVAIVSTGEATGKLDMVLQDLVTHLEWREELASQIKQASIYPAFLVGLIIGVIVILMTFTLPQFIPVLKGFNVPLPAPTRILIAASDIFQGYWIHMLVFVILFVVTYKVTNRTPQGRYFWDGVKLKIPLVGKLQHKILLSQFAHNFSILYSAGIGIIESFQIIQRVVGNEVIRAALVRCLESIEQGGTIYDSLKKEKTFPPLVLRMIQVGESTGSLDRSLQKVSQYYDKEVPAAIKKMFSVFEPALILVMGGVVLFIALAILLPTYKLTATIGQHH